MSRSDDSFYNRSQFLTDVYPRQQDPFKPGNAPGAMPGAVDPAQQMATILAGFVTTPGQRPTITQKGVNFQFPVTTTPTPLSAARFEVDSLVIGVVSTAANSIFAGFGGSTSVTSGIEFRPGIPQEFASDNDREQWELQRSLEMMATLFAWQSGMPLPSSFRSPRIVMDLNSIYVVAAAPTTIAVMVFNVPEQQ